MTNAERIQKTFGDVMFSAMLPKDLPEVVAIESSVHTHPWSIGNFEDALSAGYIAEVLRDVQGNALGYFLCMPVIDETEILDIAVSASLHRQGLGHFLINRMVHLAKAQQMQRILLEVRVSNHAAIQLYQHCGFVEIGRRKQYYPVDATHREDAIMMQLTLLSSAL